MRYSERLINVPPMFAVVQRWLVPTLAALLASSLGVASAQTRSGAVPIAEGVYVLYGTNGEVAPENAGRVANAGFLVGPTGITVIDTGVSNAHGKALRDAIRAVSDKPIEVVINTHAVQEFLFGNGAFLDSGATFICHEKSAELMRQRCEHCLENLNQILGEQTMRGTRLIVPYMTVAGSTAMRPGGRDIELIYMGWASTPGDLMVLDKATGVLFAGGVVTQGRVPEMRDGKLDAWIDAIDAIAKLPVSRIVPGFGQSIAREDARATADYLRAIDQTMRALYHENMSLIDALDRSELKAFEHWAAYTGLHRKNALHHYLQLEIEDLNR